MVNLIKCEAQQEVATVERELLMYSLSFQLTEQICRPVISLQKGSISPSLPLHLQASAFVS